MVRSPDDTHFFDITTGLLHGDKLAQLISIICPTILKKSVDSNLHHDFTLAK